MEARGAGWGNFNSDVDSIGLRGGQRLLPDLR